MPQPCASLRRIETNNGCCRSGPRGFIGPQGERGPRGLQGPTGPAGIGPVIVGTGLGLASDITVPGDGVPVPIVFDGGFNRPRAGAIVVDESGILFEVPGIYTVQITGAVTTEELVDEPLLTFTPVFTGAQPGTVAEPPSQVDAIVPGSINTFSDFFLINVVDGPATLNFTASYTPFEANILEFQALAVYIGPDVDLPV